MDVVKKLWGFCNTLRDEGINYGQYIEQLTYLLFLKIADEKNLEIPQKYNWKSLTNKTGTELLEHYQTCLRKLGKSGGILTDIFAGSLSQFRDPVNLKKLIDMIDEIRWSTIDVDIKGEAYEGLLQKYAEEQKGAGQYFTPRPLIRAIVQCIAPDIKKKETINDPAMGTGGFLLGALEYILKQTNEAADLTREENQFLLKKMFSGNEIVMETKRLALMNMFLHGIQAEIYYGDSLAEGPHTGKKHNIIMTNPPFGIKSGGNHVTRSDFSVTSSNKQLNFVQHVMSNLLPNGKAAMVVPDNVLFDSGAGTRIRKILLEDFALHTILRLPVGTFTPYAAGVKANVIFFSKTGPTKETWIYDLRTNIEKIAKKRKLTEADFQDFVSLYKNRKETERFRKYTLNYIKDRNYTLDIFELKDDSLGDGTYPEPSVILDSIQASGALIVGYAKDIQDEIEKEFKGDVEG